MIGNFAGGIRGTRLGESLGGTVRERKRGRGKGKDTLAHGLGEILDKVGQGGNRKKKLSENPIKLRLVRE